MNMVIHIGSFLPRELFHECYFLLIHFWGSLQNLSFPLEHYRYSSGKNSFWYKTMHLKQIGFLFLYWCVIYATTCLQNFVQGYFRMLPILCLRCPILQMVFIIFFPELLSLFFHCTNSLIHHIQRLSHLGLGYYERSKTPKLLLHTMQLARAYGNILSQ